VSGARRILDVGSGWINRVFILEIAAKDEELFTQRMPVLRE